MQNIFYCILKNYKGIFTKKHRGNTHLFLVPITEGKFLYLGLLGEETDEPGNYICQLIIKLPDEIIESIVEEEEKYFGERFLVMEKLPCSTKKNNEGNYIVKLSKKGSYIGSDLELEFNTDYSTQSKRIYTLKGELNFEAEDVDSKADIHMAATKQSALIGDKERFEEIVRYHLGGNNKMSKRDDILFEQACKLYLLDIVKESESLKKKLSKVQLLEMGMWVTNMSRKEVVSNIFYEGAELTNEQFRDYEGKIKKAAKYGGAAVAGRYLAHKAFGSEFLPAVKGPGIKFGRGKLGVPGVGRQFGKTKAGVMGALAGVGVMYLYRKLTDPCFRKAGLTLNPSKRKEIQLTCKADAMKKVMSNIQSQMASCDNATNPEKCKAKLKNEIDKWSSRLKDTMAQLRK